MTPREFSNVRRATGHQVEARPGRGPSDRSPARGVEAGPGRTGSCGLKLLGLTEKSLWSPFVTSAGWFSIVYGSFQTFPSSLVIEPAASAALAILLPRPGSV